MSAPLDASREGFVSETAVYDRKSMKTQDNNGASDMALHQVRTPNDLDVNVSEVVFLHHARHRNPYDGSKSMMAVGSSLNGITVQDNRSLTVKQRAQLIEDQISPVGFALERVVFKEEGIYQTNRGGLAVQTAGKASIRTTKEIPLGKMVRAVVPTHLSRTGRNRHHDGTPSTKAVLEMEPVETGASFAERTIRSILARNMDDDDVPPGFITAKEQAFSKIEDAAIMNYIGTQMAFSGSNFANVPHGMSDADTLSMTNLLATMQSPSGPPTAIQRRKEILRTIFDPSRNTTWFNSLPNDIQIKMIDSQNRCFSGYADLMRFEGDFLMGKCVRFKDGMADLLY